MSFSDQHNDDLVESLYKKVKKRMRMKEIANEFLETTEYSAARQILDGLLQLQEDNDGRLATLLQIAECEVMMNRKIKDETDSHILRIFELCNTSCQAAHEMAQQQDYAASIVLYLYACKLYRSQAAPNVAVDKIEACTQASTREVEKMIEKPQLKSGAHKIALLPVDMLKLLRGIHGADLDRKNYAEAKCLNRVGYVLDDMARLHEAITYYKQARELMTSHFRSTAPKYQIYSAIANNIAASLLKLSEFEEAAYYHRHALEEVKMAEDISESERQKDIENYSRGLKISGDVSKWSEMHGTKLGIVFGKGEENERTKQLKKEIFGDSDFASMRSSDKAQGFEENDKQRETLNVNEHRPISQLKSGTYENPTVLKKVPVSEPDPQRSWDAESEPFSKYSEFQKGSVMKHTTSEEPPLVSAKTHQKKQQKTDPLALVGKDIYVDHTKSLKDGHLVFEGKFHGENVAVRKMEYSQNAMSEAERMVLLEKHHNIVDYKEWVIWESQEITGFRFVYLAMELCESKTLDELAKDINFSMEDRVRSLLHFTRGLCHIHHHGIIHGDLKPRRLLRSIGEHAIKITGLEKSKKLESRRTHFTITCSSSKTRSWLVPDCKLTMKWDIYSAGLIFYYLLSNGQNFSVDGPDGLTRLTCPNADAAKDLISRMTNKDPDKRPAAKECLDSALFLNRT